MKFENLFFSGKKRWHPLTEQSFTERSAFYVSLRNVWNLKNWMHFCVLKTSNWFFEFLWKEKMCLLSAANIEYKNIEEKYHIDYYNAFFGTFLAPLRNSLRSVEKHEKTSFACEYRFFLRNFHARCWPQIKHMFFLFTKIEKINSKALKRKSAFSLLVFQDYYVQ